MLNCCNIAIIPPQCVEEHINIISKKNTLTRIQS